MAEYRLTESAENDLLDIALYGMEQFGEAQSIDYRNRLKRHFQALAEQPLLYPAVNHIRIGYRRSVCGSHSVYYRLEDDSIEIIRILGRQDVQAIM